MIPALIIGRKGSRLKDKNVYPILGRPLVQYPILAAQNSKNVDEIFVSTDCEKIKAVALKEKCTFIERPAYLASNEALAEDAFKHGYDKILEMRKSEPEFVVLLFANGVTVTPGIIDEGIEFLRKNPDFDSAVTVSKYNMFSPLRARKIEDGKVLPFIDPKMFENASCDRDSQGDTYYMDCSTFILRTRCFDYSKGEIPFRWVGRKVHPLHQEGGFDVDHGWQLGAVEYWLKDHGFTERGTPYDK